MCVCGGAGDETVGPGLLMRAERALPLQGKGRGGVVCESHPRQIDPHPSATPL